MACVRAAAAMVRVRVAEDTVVPWTVVWTGATTRVPTVHTPCVPWPPSFGVDEHAYRGVMMFSTVLTSTSVRGAVSGARDGLC